MSGVILVGELFWSTRNFGTDKKCWKKKPKGHKSCSNGCARGEDTGWRCISDKLTVGIGCRWTQWSSTGIANSSVVISGNQWCWWWEGGRPWRRDKWDSVGTCTFATVSVNNPAATGKRKSTNNAVWNVVKHLKDHTAHSVVVDTKYTHVCVAPITVSEAGDLGADFDSDGNSLWFCNKVFTLSKTKNCYRSSQTTRHYGKFHGDTSSSGKTLADRTSHNNTHKRHVMETASLKTGQ